MRGVEGGTKDAERAIRYVTKYVTKNLADTAAPRGEHARAHFDRLHAELAILPCSPSCANWLLYGVQPGKAKPGLVPGRCVGKVHQADTLGFTGRRVLISRNWSGKTLTDHRHDNHTWVKAILAGHLTDANNDQGDQPNQPGRYTFEHAPTRRPRRATAAIPAAAHRPPAHRLESSPRQSTRQNHRRCFGNPKSNDAAGRLTGGMLMTDLLTGDQVAGLLKTTPRFVRRLVAERRIECVKVGRLVRFAPAAVERYISGQTVVAQSRAHLRRALREVA